MNYDGIVDSPYKKEIIPTSLTHLYHTKLLSFLEMLNMTANSMKGARNKLFRNVLRQYEAAHMYRTEKFRDHMTACFSE